MYQILENKQKFISQIMTSKTPVRVADDIDEQALSYGEIKALATGNPHILEKTQLDSEVAKLKLLKQSHLSQIYDIEDRIAKYFPKEINRLEEKIKAMECDSKILEENTPSDKEEFSTMSINDVEYSDKESAGKAILEMCKEKKNADNELIGIYKGFKLELGFNSYEKKFTLTMKNKYSYEIFLGGDIYGNIQRIDNCLSKIKENIPEIKERLENEKLQLENAKKEAQKEFPQEQELKDKMQRLEEVNILLKLNEKEHEIFDGEIDDEDRKKHDYDRNQNR